MYKWGVWLVSAALAAFVVAGFFAAASSALQSPNFQIDESSVGSGGLNQSSSANFRASNATNDLSVGSSSSSNFQVETGTQTTHDPTLSFKISSLNVNFGKFSPGTAATTTANFTVANYTSYGYVVQVVGSPPTNGSHSIEPMTTTTDSISGVEQFGLNLVANTTPRSVGANPLNGPTSHGVAAPNYAITNKFRYVNGETVAYSPKSSGETAYTISYVVNVAPLTPGGIYTSNQTLIVTGTY